MIEFVDIQKSYQDKTILKGINLKLEDGKLMVLIGPSGCGKTTTLKMINKLIEPTKGSILINGEDIAEKNTIELRRTIGYVIQQTGLFPHMNIGENIAVVPYLKKWPKDKIKNRVEELLNLVGLNAGEFINRYPQQLSGGEQQRVGVARALATNPQIILMDEPFSALDPITRRELQTALNNLQKQLKKTIVFVTHDMEEAIKLGDKICIMNSGEIVQYDTPENILQSPANDFVARFIGHSETIRNTI
jgi:glycine betaine/L-proline transport ATP binding subunit